MDDAAGHHLTLTPEQRAEVAAIYRAEAAFLELIEARIHPAQRGGREMSLARTNLQQARMWAIEGITA